MKFKNRKLIFGFRFLAMLDVFFSRKFELTTYYKGSELVKSKTKFDKDELLNHDFKTKRKPKS